MSPVKQSIKFMLTHSVVSFVLVVGILVFFSVFQLMVPSQENATMQSLATNLMSVFLGVYLGGAMQSLKQNYLWIINQQYRNSIMAAFLIIIGFFSLIQMPIHYLNSSLTRLVLLVPFCVAIFSSHLVLGKNFLYKLLIPAIPVGVFQLHRLNINLDMVIIVLILATLVLIAAMYLNLFTANRLGLKRNTQAATADYYGGHHLKIITSINYVLGVVAAKWVLLSKRKIDWVVLMPLTKLAIYPLLYILIVFFLLMLITDAKDNPNIEFFTVIFLSVSIIDLIMGSRRLIRQTRVIAHVFAGSNHQQLKNKILIAIDKTNLINSIVFVGGVFIVVNVFSVSFNSHYILTATLAVTIIALAYYPLLLCMSWVNISFQLLASIVGYYSLVFIAVQWLKINHTTIMTSNYTFAFIVACLLLRATTQYIFWKQSIEKLMKN